MPVFKLLCLMICCCPVESFARYTVIVLVYHSSGSGSFPDAVLGLVFFFFQAEDGIRDSSVTGVQTCALPIWGRTADRGGSHNRPRRGHRPSARNARDAVGAPRLGPPVRHPDGRKRDPG